MSHEMIDGELVFNCDGPRGDGTGCNKNYSAGNSKFRETWNEARAMGWTNYQTFVKSISTWRAACPDCTKKLGG